MFKRLGRVLKSYVFAPAGRPDELRDPDWEDRRRELERDARKIRKALEERNRAAEALREEVSRLREGEQDLVLDAAREAQLSLLRDLAEPAARLQALHHLASEQDRPPDARDVLLVAQRLLRGLERHGLAFEGAPGDEVSFDPARHAPRSRAHDPVPGAPVIVRSPGATFEGHRLKKAEVDPVP